MILVIHQSVPLALIPCEAGHDQLWMKEVIKEDKREEREKLYY